jgi:hypothetical protein
MSDDAPVLGLTSQELLQYTQFVNAAAAALQRIRARRDRNGRLAAAEDEHAELQHEQRQHPPVRLMREDEQLEWQRRVPSELLAQHSGERVSVWSARLVDHTGTPTGEWGLETRTWDERGAPTATVFAVCRDAEDALAMTGYLREHGTPQRLAELQDLATRGRGQFVRPAPPDPVTAAGRSGRPRPAAVPIALSEQDWAAVLRRVLPPEVADAVIAIDPNHPHHRAWKELHALANEEVIRVGADPEQLARLLRSDSMPGLARRVPRWNGDVQNAPSLGHWAITQARTNPRYDQIIAGKDPTETPAADRAATPAPGSRSAATAPPSPAAAHTRVRLAEIRNMRQAVQWAQALDATDPQHRLEAKAGFGHWGSQVDAILATKYPGLTASARAAAMRSRAAERDTVVVVTGELDAVGLDAAGVEETASLAPQVPAPRRAPETDPVTLRGFAAEVERLDPNKVGDRIHAQIMVGRVDPQIDRLIVEKFPDDPKIAEKVALLYPDGLPEADAASWRALADADDAVAVADRSTPDDPRTPQREDLDGAVTAQPAAAAATQHRGIAATVAGTQPPVVRRVLQRPDPTTTVIVRRG